MAKEVNIKLENELSRHYILGHSRFQTSATLGPSVFHFVSNRSLPIIKTFQFRVFPHGPAHVVFSDTKDLQNLHISLLLDDTQTIVVTSDSFDHTVTKNEPYKVKYGKLNDLYIDFSEEEINFNGKVTITGDFEELNFIGFKSEDQASWVVKESMFLMQLRKIIICLIVQ